MRMTDACTARFHGPAEEVEAHVTVNHSAKGCIDMFSQRRPTKKMTEGEFITTQGLRTQRVKQGPYEMHINFT